jgi:hypothetical protein
MTPLCGLDNSPMQWLRAWAAATVLWTCACTPALDWREVHPEGSGALALFPCRPVGLTRSLQLGGGSVPFSIHACRAGHAVYALGFADVGDPGRVTPALRELREAAVANLGARSADALPLAVQGSTPNAQAGAWRFDGFRPDGAQVRESIALFAHGTRVYQASVLGSAVDAETVRGFFDGLRVNR